MKMNNKLKGIIALTLLISLTTVINENAKAELIQDQPQQNEYYTVIGEDGHVEFIKYEDEEIGTLSSNDYVVDGEIYDTYEEAQEALSQKPKVFSRSNSQDEGIVAVANTANIKVGVAKIKGYVTYKEYDGTGKGRAGYTHGSSASDAAYVATLDSGKTIRVKQAGTFMDIPSASVEVTEYNSKTSKVSYYMGSNGIFRHYYYYGTNQNLASTQVGYTPSYLKDGVKYFSYDGHYFYTDYATMINDYKAGAFVNTHAVNASSPYYNYYQYLSFRSSTNFIASDIDAFIEKAISQYSSVDTRSKLRHQGQSLLNNQGDQGVNASLMLGVAINESAWGMSHYAQDRNNLFGIGAVDSNPDAAKRFNTVEECFNYFSKNMISNGYLDAAGWRYRGPHLGDKASGVNVKYASDPYWGEKAASFSYALNADNGDKDFNKYQLGIANSGDVKFYRENTLTKLLFSSGASDNTNDKVYHFPVTILDTETNYKILSDTILSEDRSKLQATGVFKLSKDYVYVKKSDITLVYQTDFKPGDVNGDGKVTSLDYIQIKNHIMKTKVLSGATLIRADVNKDGKVTSLDYIKIKNHIMGTNKLF